MRTSPDVIRRANAVHVLLYGADQKQQTDINCSTKDVLGSHWPFSLGHAVDPEEAVDHIRRREDLEIVYCCMQTACRLRQDASRFVRLLAAHRRSPWVVLDLQLSETLAYVFEREGVRVLQEELPVAIARRWDLRSGCDTAMRGRPSGF